MGPPLEELNQRDEFPSAARVSGLEEPPLRLRRGREPAVIAIRNQKRRCAIERAELGGDNVDGVSALGESDGDRLLVSTHRCLRIAVLKVGANTPEDSA